METLADVLIFDEGRPAVRCRPPGAGDVPALVYDAVRSFEDRRHVTRVFLAWVSGELESGSAGVPTTWGPERLAWVSVFEGVSRPLRGLPFGSPPQEVLCHGFELIDAMTGRHVSTFYSSRGGPTPSSVDAGGE